MVIGFEPNTIVVEREVLSCVVDHVVHGDRRLHIKGCKELSGSKKRTEDWVEVDSMESVERDAVLRRLDVPGRKMQDSKALGYSASGRVNMEGAGCQGSGL
jgi:hypothetical protein